MSAKKLSPVVIPEIRLWVEKTYKDNFYYYIKPIIILTVKPINVYTIGVNDQPPGLVTIIYGDTIDSNTKKINIRLEDFNYIHLIGSGDYVRIIINKGVRLREADKIVCPDVDKMASHILGFFTPENIKEVNEIISLSYKKQLELSKKMDALLLEEEAESKALASKKKASVSAKPSDSLRAMADEINTGSHEDIETGELSYDTDLSFVKAFVKGTSASAAESAAASAPASAAGESSAAARLVSAVAEGVPASLRGHSPVFNSYKLNQRDMDSYILFFNSEHGSRLDYILLYNREYRKPVFLIINTGGGYMHLNIGPNGIHFTLERIKSLDSEKYHINLNFMREGKKSEAGGASSKSAIESDIKIIDAEGTTIDPNYISKQFNASLSSKPSASAGAGSGSAGLRGFKFIPNSIILLLFLKFLIERKVLDLNIEMKGGNYYEKYMKYKTKYLQLKKLLQ